MSHNTIPTFAATFCVILAAASGSPLRAQGGDASILHACYHPSSGTVYRIKAPGAPDACKENDVEFSWPAVGQSGAQGEQGDVGPEGAKGKTGPKGVRGVTGPDGVRGDDGDRGPVGQPGARGATGPTGDRGADGDKGGQGDDGPIGDKGQTGGPGVKGDRGDTGPQGLPGNDGTLQTHISISSELEVHYPNSRESIASCPDGFVVVSGGVRTVNNRRLFTTSSKPDKAAGAFEPDSWRVKVRVIDPNTSALFRIYALCVSK